MLIWKLETVSYTHLDVYKRQDRDEAFQLFDPKLILCDVNAKRKEDVISRGCQLLYEKGYVKKEMCIRDREEPIPAAVVFTIIVMLSVL